MMTTRQRIEQAHAYLEQIRQAANDNLAIPHDVYSAAIHGSATLEALLSDMDAEAERMAEDLRTDSVAPRSQY